MKGQHSKIGSSTQFLSLINARQLILLWVHMLSSGSGKTTSKNVEVSMCVIGANGRVIEVRELKAVRDTSGAQPFRASATLMWVIFCETSSIFFLSEDWTVFFSLVWHRYPVPLILAHLVIFERLRKKRSHRSGSANYPALLDTEMLHTMYTIAWLCLPTFAGLHFPRSRGQSPQRVRINDFLPHG